MVIIMEILTLDVNKNWGTAMFATEGGRDAVWMAAVV